MISEQDLEYKTVPIAAQLHYRNPLDSLLQVNSEFGNLRWLHTFLAKLTCNIGSRAVPRNTSEFIPYRTNNVMVD